MAEDELTIEASDGKAYALQVSCPCGKARVLVDGYDVHIPEEHGWTFTCQDCGEVFVFPTPELVAQVEAQQAEKEA